MAFASHIVFSFVSIISLISPAVAAEIWKPVFPPYNAWAIDKADDGTVVFAGSEKPGLACLKEGLRLEEMLECLEGRFENFEGCQSVGCSVFKVSPEGEVSKLFTESGGYGIMDVAVSHDGKRVAAAALKSELEGSQNGGHVWMWKDGKAVKARLEQQVFAVEYGKDGQFRAVGQGGLVLRSKSNGTWVREARGILCALYAVDLNGPRSLVTGWSGTYYLPGHGRRAKKIGPGAGVLWSSSDGKTIVINSQSGSSLIKSTDGGRSWEGQKLVDSVGYEECTCSSGNNPNTCSDEVSGARLYIAAVRGTSPDDLWMLGSRADIPGARVYHHRGGNTWERVRFPAEVWPASDAIFAEAGRPLVATMEGMYSRGDADYRH